jgi:predicted phosphodiesterase
MRIGLISDTHIPHDAEVLPTQAKEVFRGVDLILHAGDIYLSSVLDELEEIAPVLAAKGDDDLPSVNGRVKEKHVLNFEGFSLWLTHVFPYFSLHSLQSFSYSSLRSLHTFLYSPLARSASFDQELEEALKEIVEREDVPDILVFGGTHKASWHRIQGFLFINPGSATLPDYKRVLGTVAVLTIAPGKAEADIIQL